MSMVHELSCTQKRVAGLKQVLRYARSAMLEKVYIAKDADEEIVRRLSDECERHRIPYDLTHTMHQIGGACGIDVGSACAGVLRKQ